MTVPVSRLDLKLAVRMLVRYPWLSLVSVLAVAFAIFVGAGAFEIASQVLFPRLPLEDGARIVGVQSLDRRSTATEGATLHDFAAWSAESRTVEGWGAVRNAARNLFTGEGAAEPVEVAAITASGFHIARVPPLLGRHLVAEDERADAEPVVVIGQELWQKQFAGDPAIVGRRVRLGREVHTVVGVMPAGFGFPAAHRLWVPLRLDPLDYAPGESPRVWVFGRLAPGVSLAEARAELAAIGARTAADAPETHAHLHVRLDPYALAMMNLPRVTVALGMGSVNLFLVMLVVLICGNVALLLFARAAAREGELVVRSALGATRGRLTGQLFAEALVLAAIGAAIGLGAVQLGLGWAMESLRLEVERLPFWMRPTLSPSTVGYAVLLALLAAAVAGVVPGIKATRGLRAGLQRASAGGGGFRFGGVWTAVIVAQIAATVGFPVAALLVHRDASQYRHAELGIPQEQVLMARVEMDLDLAAAKSAGTASEAFRARYVAAVQRLRERLAADPSVREVRFAERLPRMYHTQRLVEVDGGGAAPVQPSGGGYRVSSTSVEPGFFELFDAPVLAGRGFHSADMAPDARSVIVNESFVRLVLGGRNPLGRRIRDVRDGQAAGGDHAAVEPWYEIVGVVRDLGLSVGNPGDSRVAGFYHPVAPGGVYPGYLAVRLHGDAAVLASRLQVAVTREEPELRLYEVQPLSDANEAELRFLSFWFRLSTAVSFVAMVLSLAGIYAVMSFTVAQRTREIGIRVALGAGVGRVIRAIFRRPLTQVGLGLLLGTIVGAFLLAASGALRFSAAHFALLVAYAVAMACVCLLACIVPMRRALGVEPTEALRAEL